MNRQQAENRITSAHPLVFTEWLARQLGEDTPKQRFNLMLNICLVGQVESLHMLKRAKAMKEEGSEKTLGGLWFSQVNEKQQVTERLRRAIRIIMDLEPHAVPSKFE